VRVPSKSKHTTLVLENEDIIQALYTYVHFDGENKNLPLSISNLKKCAPGRPENPQRPKSSRIVFLKKYKKKVLKARLLNIKLHLFLFFLDYFLSPVELRSE
jgi:hypothetical protein